MRFLLAVLFLVMTAGFFISTAYLSGGDQGVMASFIAGFSARNLSGLIGSFGVIIALLVPGAVVAAMLVAMRVAQWVGWPAALAGAFIAATGAGLYALDAPQVDAVLRVLTG